MDISHQSLSAFPLLNESWIYSFNTSASYNFKSGIKGQLYLSLLSPKYLLQGSESSFSYHTISVSKDILKKRGQISITMDNIFQKYFLWSTSTQISSINYIDNTFLYNRGIRIGFTYKIGNIFPSNYQLKQEDLKMPDK
jgi:hypothetical protein